MADPATLYNVDRLYEELKKNPNAVIISAEEAVKIWGVFRKHTVTQGLVSSFKTRAFLQACLMAAMDGSAAMGFIEALFRSAYTPNATVKGIMKALVKEAFKQYFHRASLNDLGHLKLYQIVIDFIGYYNAHRFRFVEGGLDVDGDAE